VRSARPSIPPRKLSVPGLAAEWGISPDQVLRLIRAGELVAIDIALKVGSRPRYMIDRGEVERFEKRRTVKTVKIARRTRQREDKGIIKFF
jgi:hypothetical protein